MFIILYHRQFLKIFDQLPQNIKQKSIELEKIFKQNPFFPSLQTKALAGKLKGLYSFRITREYRVIFKFSSREEALFLKIKHRKDIYR